MEKQIQVVDVTHRKHESVGFHMVRDWGQDAFLFLHFLTHATLNIDGEMIDVAPNACIIYTPGVRQDYRAALGSDGFENNFVTFKMDATVSLANYKFPLNEPFYIQNEDAITGSVEWITWASANRILPLEDDITNEVYNLLSLIEKGMIISNPKRRRDNQARLRFVALRGEVRLHPKEWTVEKMADSCWLTRSRFSVLYKSFFGVTPSEDLICATLEYAKERLLNSCDSIVDISKDCGYKQVESFIRAFSKKEGITPGKYRKKKKI